MGGLVNTHLCGQLSPLWMEPWEQRHPSQHKHKAERVEEQDNSILYGNSWGTLGSLRIQLEHFCRAASPGAEHGGHSRGFALSLWSLFGRGRADGVVWPTSAASTPGRLGTATLRHNLHFCLPFQKENKRPAVIFTKQVV